MLRLSNKIFSLKYKLVLLSEKDLIFKHKLIFPGFPIKLGMTERSRKKDIKEGKRKNM